MLSAGVWAQSAKVVSDSPENRDFGIREARVGRYESAYARLLPWTRTHPEDTEARFHAAWSAAFLGRTYEAADLLMGLDEQDPRVQFLWGKLLLDKRDAAGAIEVLEPLARGAPTELDLQVRRLLAKAWMAVGRAERAIPLLEGFGNDDPGLALELALARYEAGDVEGAVRTLAPQSRAVLDSVQDGESSPDDPMSVALLFEYGRFQVTAARHSEAVPFLEASVSLAPGCRQCWQQLAQAYAALGQLQEARRAKERFEGLLRSEIPNEEKQRLEARDQQDPTGKVLREASESYREGRAGEALTMLEAESRLRPDDPRPLQLAARILVEQGNPEGALALAAAAVEIAPEDADGYYVRGSVFLSLARVEEARRDFTQALELAPDHAAAARSLERLPPG